MLLLVKCADSLAGLCRRDEISKWVSRNNTYLTLSKVILPFRVTSETSDPPTPKTEDRTVCAIGNVSVEYQRAIFTLRIKLHLQRLFCFRAGNQIWWDCLLK